MAPLSKTVSQYESEAEVVGDCLIHESAGAARKVYIRRHGNIPSDVAVCHTCDNPKCILDAHHFIGSWKDNVRDAVIKGRHSCFSEELHLKRIEGVKKAAESGSYANNHGNRSGIPNITTEERDWIESLLSEGVPACRIIEITGRSNSTIHRIRRAIKC